MTMWPVTPREFRPADESGPSRLTLSGRHGTNSLRRSWTHRVLGVQGVCPCIASIHRLCGISRPTAHPTTLPLEAAVTGPALARLKVPCANSMDTYPLPPKRAVPASPRRGKGKACQMPPLPCRVASALVRGAGGGGAGGEGAGGGSTAVSCVA